MRTNGARTRLIVVSAVAVLIVTGGLLVALALKESGEPVPNAGQVTPGFSPQEITQRDDRFAEASRLPVLPGPDSTVQATFIGDSITNEGFYAKTEQSSYRGRVEQALAARFNTAFARYGYAGATINDALRSLPTAIPRSSLYVVEIGTNDVANTSRRTDQIRDYTEVLERVRSVSSNASLVCLGVWGPSNDPAVDSLNQAESKACVAAGGRFVSISYLYDNTTLRGPLGTVLSPGRISDDFHPNDDGHERIASILLGQLQLPDRNVKSR